MIAGYYDRTTYPEERKHLTCHSREDAPYGHHLADLDGCTHNDTYPNNPLIASYNRIDGRTIKGSIDDYWIQYGSTANDPYITGGWTQHTWGTAIAIT